MESTDKKSSDGTSEHLVVEDQNNASQNAQDQALLNALQEFVIPLIRGAVGQQGGDDINPIALGPAGKLITALKEFISTVVHSQPENKTVIETSLSEEGIANLNRYQPEPSITAFQELPYFDHSESDSDDDEYGKHVLKIKKFKIMTQFNCFTSVATQRSTFEEYLQAELQERVFNKMPIRLLHFKPHANGSSLQITLVERGAVYAHFEAMLKAKTNEASISKLIRKYVRYAILSHTWLRAASEVTYSDWSKGSFDATAAGYQKLVNFCKVAWRDHGLTFGWMDTVCINKDSSSELDESIRSMYNWYERAAVCITYLATTETFSSMHLDPWFTRGWTLQELLAPKVIKFYNRNWNKFVKGAENDKTDAQIQDAIERATTILQYEFHRIHDAPISRRMELAAKRQVTREEDTAYSLMGIFNVSIATAYGEGADRAFNRLLREILTTADEGVLDIFNVAGFFRSFDNSMVLPGSPQDYMSRSTEASEAAAHIVPTEPLILTHLGLRVSVILMPGILIRDAGRPWIPTHNPAGPIGNFDATADLFPVNHTYLGGIYHLLDEQVTGPNGPNVNGVQAKVSFAVFNFTGDTKATIYIPETCLAWALEHRSEDVVLHVPTSNNPRYVHTREPITFNLNSKTTQVKRVERNVYYAVKADDLPKHGMQLVSMYW